MRIYVRLHNMLAVMLTANIKAVYSRWLHLITLPCCNIHMKIQVLGIHLEAYHWRLPPPHTPPAVQTEALPLYPLPEIHKHILLMSVLAKLMIFMTTKREEV